MSQENQTKRVLQNLEPQKVFYYFEAITRIPHGSENEKTISDYVVALARERGYQVQQDASYNVAVAIPASAGYADRKTITLQAHLDMVCQKEAGVEFDFTTQPLPIYIENGFIRSKGTTLGADDGFGVAMLLAIMDSPELEHAPLQLLFTTAEEIFLVGARNMADDMIQGQYLVGLDCAFDNAIVVSCAGISISRAVLKMDRQNYNPTTSATYTVTISGLTGGHSGNTIHYFRANAIKVLGELLSALYKEVPFRIAQLTGGTVINAIPAEASAQLVCAKADAQKLENALNTLADRIKRAFYRTDGAMQISCTPRAAVETATAYSEARTVQAIRLLTLLPSGPRSLIDDNFTSAECSSNLAILEEHDDELHARIAIRSNSEYQHDALLDQYSTIAGLLGAEYRLQQRLAAWEYRPSSLLRDKAAQIYAELNGEKPIIKKIHAAVEAVEFVGKMNRRGQSIDIINIGCNNLDPHTPNERLEIASVGKTYRLVTRLIRELD